MFSLRASLFASYISNSETKDSSPALWNIGQQLTLLFCVTYERFRRDMADLGLVQPRVLELLDVVSEYQH